MTAAEMKRVDTEGLKRWLRKGATVQSSVNEKLDEKLKVVL